MFSLVPKGGTMTTKTKPSQESLIGISALIFIGILIVGVAVAFYVYNQVSADRNRIERLEALEVQDRAFAVGGAEVVIYPSNSEYVFSFGSTPGTDTVGNTKRIWPAASLNDSVYETDVYSGDVVDKISLGYNVMPGDMVLVWFAKDPAQGLSVPKSPDIWAVPAYYWDSYTGFSVAIHRFSGQDPTAVFVR